MRNKSFLVALLGGAATVVLGTGLISATADSVVSPGNRLQSGTFTDLHEVKASVVNNSTSCASSTPTDSPVATGTFTTMNMDSATPGSSQSADNFCVFNTGYVSGDVYINLENIVSLDLGCSGSESAVDTCAAADDPGELLALLTTSRINLFTPSGVGQTGNCSPTSTTFAALTSGSVRVGTVDPGESCEIFFTFSSAGSAEQRRIAQSDAVQFDIRFTLQDTPAP